MLKSLVPKFHHDLSVRYIFILYIAEKQDPVKLKPTEVNLTLLCFWAGLMGLLVVDCRRINPGAVGIFTYPARDGGGVPPPPSAICQTTGPILDKKGNLIAPSMIFL